MIFLEIPFLASAIILILPTAVYRISAYQKWKNSDADLHLKKSFIQFQLHKKKEFSGFPILDHKVYWIIQFVVIVFLFIPYSQFTHF